MPTLGQLIYTIVPVQVAPAEAAKCITFRLEPKQEIAMAPTQTKEQLGVSNDARNIETSTTSRELFVLRLRDSLNWLRRTPTRTSTPYQETERNVRDSIRQLSRQRVSDLLRQLRAAHGLSYEQVTERTGLSGQLLFDVEFKDRRLTLEETRKLAECYQISIDDLLGIDVD
jgi:ribosome-binding protein aMBF1 (putative translation factor)